MIQPFKAKVLRCIKIKQYPNRLSGIVETGTSTIPNLVPRTEKNDSDRFQPMVQLSRVSCPAVSNLKFNMKWWILMLKSSFKGTYHIFQHHPPQKKHQFQDHLGHWSWILGSNFPFLPPPSIHAFNLAFNFPCCLKASRASCLMLNGWSYDSTRTPGWFHYPPWNQHGA